MFYSNARKRPGWKVVLKKEVRARRILPNDEEEMEAEMFDLGHDEDFDGLRPEREVGEGLVHAVRTGYTIVMQEVLIPRRRRGVPASARGGRLRGRRGNARGRSNCTGRAGGGEPSQRPARTIRQRGKATVTTRKWSPNQQQTNIFLLIWVPL